MFNLSSAVLGTTLLLIGVAFFVLTLLVIRYFPKTRTRTRKSHQSFIDNNIPDHEDAVIMIKPGGNISYANPAAKKQFNFWDNKPSLERLARFTRPNHVFWGLCTNEGQANIRINGHPYLGTSYYVPGDNGKTVVLALKPKKENQIKNSVSETIIETMESLSQLNVRMRSGLDLEPILQAILERIELLIPTDISEIAIWDKENENFRPHRLTGTSGLDRGLEKISEYASDHGSLSSYIAERDEAVLLPDLEAFMGANPSVNIKGLPCQSVIGISLQVNGELVGTLELYSNEKSAFSERDVHTLSVLSRQISATIYNALKYHIDQKRAEELSSLANLAKTVSSARDDQDLYAHLVYGITPLLDVEIAGFLIYDEPKQALIAQNPFIGIPSEFIPLYQVVIKTDSPAEEIWQSQTNIITRSAIDDHRFIDLGLDHAARAAGVRDSALIPLRSGGRSLGYLQAANKKDGTSFSEDDVRLLEIIVLQAAPIIENAALINKSVGRALRAEALRRIASLSGSKATLDEIYKYSLVELARLLQADLAGIFLLVEDLGELEVHSSSLFGIHEDQLDLINRIPIGDESFRYSVTASKKAFISGNASNDERVLPAFSNLIEPLNIVSVIDVPLIVRDQGVGEIILCSPEEDFFTLSDVQLASTVAGQLAAAFERSKLISQTNIDLRQRIDHLTALTRIGREINISIELPYLFNLVLDEALRTTNADTGTILIFGIEDNESAKPAISMSIGESHCEELTPLEEIVVENSAPLCINNFGEPLKDYPPEVWSPPQKNIKSGLIVPITHQNKIVGLINLHSMTEDAFSQASIEIAQALAIQATIAINNTQRYQERVKQNEHLNRRIKIFSNLLQASEKLNLEQPVEVTLEEIAYGIQAATAFNLVIISRFNQQEAMLEPLISVGMPLNFTNEVREIQIPWKDLKKLMVQEFSLRGSYYIPKDHGIKLPKSINNLNELLRNAPQIRELDQTDEAKVRKNGDPRWNRDDLFFLPLLKSNDKPLGLIHLSAPRDFCPPDDPTIETLKIFASQAALVLESQLKQSSLENQIRDLSNQLEEYHITKEQLPGLLVKEKEHKKIVHSLNQSTERLRTSQRLIEQFNKKTDRLGVLISFVEELVSGMGLNAALVAQPGTKGPQLIHGCGEISEYGKLEALLGQRNPFLACFEDESTIIVENVIEDPVWKKSPMLISLDAVGFICLPIKTGIGVNAAVLGITHSEMEPFSDLDKNLFELLSHQAGIAINNLNIISETGYRLQEVNLLLDFSRQLESLEQGKILSALLESALEVAEESQAGLVALFDENQNKLIPAVVRGYNNTSSMMKVRYGLDGTILGSVYQDGEPVIVNEVNYAKSYKLEPDDLFAYQKATGGNLPLSCLVAPIRSGDKHLGVIVLDNFRETEPFTVEDRALITSLSQQTALSLENARLFQAAEKRANQLQALSEVASAITHSLEPDALINSLLEKLETVVPYTTGTLWLRDDDNLTIQAARGFNNSDELIGVSTATEDSQLFSEMIETKQAISVKDVRFDNRFPSIGSENLSWLGVPLIAKGAMIGLIALENKEPGFYTNEHIQAAYTFSSQAAVSLENATLYQESLNRTVELDKRSQRLALLNRFSNQISSVLNPTYILETTIRELLGALNATMVSVAMKEIAGLVLRAESPKMLSEPDHVLPEAPIFERLGQTLGVFNTIDVRSESDLQPLEDFFQERNTSALMILPLVTGEELHGYLLVHNQENRRFSPDEIELGRIISNQAAVAVQNAISFESTTKLSEELEKRVAQRTAQLEQQHTRAQSLLRIMRELSASLDLDQVLNQTLEILNETVGAERSTILLINRKEQAFYFRASVGHARIIPRGGQISSLKLDEGLAGWVLENQRTALVGDVMEDDRWVPSKHYPEDYKSVIAVPLKVGEEALGVVTMAHSNKNAFSGEDQDLAQAAAMQMAVAINNAELFNLIRDQAEDLGTMLRSQQVEASRSMAILEAVANGVLVTDSNNVVTLFNNSAQHILDLDRADVIGKSLDNFIGLFGSAAQTWMETIQNWSKDPASYSIGDTYKEQIKMDRGRIVSIHLAPVAMKNEFLGTVSIFQDITHQVEVDRLKSEFVATVSHELRTPMTSIKGYVDVLLMGAAGELNQKQLGFLDIVKANTERLNILVNDLLDVSRIEAGKVALEIQPLNLGRIINEVVDEHEQLSEKDKKPMNFRINTPTEFPKVPGDEERIRQVLYNLINNAYLYTHENGRIIIDMHAFEDEIQVDIKDNGIGVRPENHEAIFERFHRGEDPLVLASSGNGLGLSIVKQLIQLHKGRIWLESDGVSGNGSTFSITLPLAKEI